MKIIKRNDQYGNEYYDKVIETNEEMQAEIKQSKKRKKKRNIIILTIIIIELAIIALCGLIMFGKIEITFLGEYQKLIAFVTVFITATIAERIARKI